YGVAARSGTGAASGRADAVRPGSQAHTQAALRLLWEAHQQVCPGEDLWQFAVRLTELRAAGVTEADLRRLVHDGLAEYRVEVTQSRSRRRQLRRWRSLAIPEGSCFALTDAGAGTASAILSADMAAGRRRVKEGRRQTRSNRPRWDRPARKFYWG